MPLEKPAFISKIRNLFKVYAREHFISTIQNGTSLASVRLPLQLNVFYT